MEITAAMLEKRGACADTVQRLRDLSGERPVIVTAALCAQHPDVNYNWAARRFLPLAARAEYERQQVVLLAECERQQAALRAECKRQQAALWAEYERQCAILFGALAECHEQSTTQD